MYGTAHGSSNLFAYSAAGAVFVTLAVKLLMDGSVGGVLARALRPVGDASYAMYLNEGFLIRLDPYTPFTMGSLLTLVLSFVFALVWNWLVIDRVTKRLRSFLGRLGPVW